MDIKYVYLELECSFPLIVSRHIKRSHMPLFYKICSLHCISGCPIQRDTEEMSLDLSGSVFALCDVNMYCSFKFPQQIIYGIQTTRNNFRHCVYLRVGSAISGSCQSN